MNTFSEPDLHQIVQSFLLELKEAESGKRTSLEYIVNQIPSHPLVSDNEIFQVMVVGGSVFKNALVKKDQTDGLILTERDEKNQPPFLSKDDFLRFVLGELHPRVKVVALNFAYPIKPHFRDNRLDGQILKGSKENTFEGMIGENVGELIEKYVKEKTGRDIMVSVANDTVCLLLSGLTQFASQTIAGGIVGTGMNFAIFMPGKKVVNLEAAWFDKFTQSPSGKIVDHASSEPGAAILEKEVSGAYLYRHFNALIKEKDIDMAPITSTAELDELAHSSNAKIADIARGILDTSAQLVACVMGAITLFYGKDTVFIMEGSLFWNANGYKDEVKETLMKLIPNYSVTFGKIEDSPIYGGAKLIS